MADIMMNNGEIFNTVFGDIMVVDIYDDIVQSAINNILLIYGEYEFHDTLGNMMYGRRNKLADISYRIIESDCKNAIMNDNRVSKVIDIIASKNNDIYGACDIAFSLEAIDGTRLSSRVTAVIS